MLKKIIAVAAAVLTAVCMLSSCSPSADGTQKLIAVPKATGDMGEIQRALYAKCGSSITLRYPRSGENRSAFLLADLDGDGVQEALAFYSVPSAEGINAVHINVIARTNGEWRSVGDVTTNGSALDRVDVADISRNKTLSILVGVEMYSSSGNQLNIYTFDKGKGLVQHVQENYTEYAVCDLMGEGSDQLALLSLNTSERTSAVSLYSFNGEAMELRGSAVTDGNISGYAQVCFGTLAGGKRALFVDANKSAVSMVTDVIYCADGQLVNPFFDLTVAETQLTQRSITALCTDINGDGVTEIPFSEILPGYADKSETDREYLTVWKSFDGQLFNDVLRADFYSDGGYRLEFPSRWVGNITLVTDKRSRMRSYRVWDPVMQTSTAEVLRIRAYSLTDFEKVDAEGVIELARNDSTVWVARIVDSSGEYAIDEATLKKLFSLI